MEGSGMKATKVVACCTLTAMAAAGIGHIVGADAHQFSVTEWPRVWLVVRAVGATALVALFGWSIWVLAE